MAVVMLPRRATWLRCRGWWGKTRACSKPETVTARRHSCSPLEEAACRWSGGWSTRAQCSTCKAAISAPPFASQAQGHTPVVRLLLEGGADPKIVDNKRRTPLIRAASTNRLEAVRCLLDHPSAAATVNHRDRRGRTALRLACGVSSRSGSQGVVRALLAKGADPTIADNSSMTPMIMASQSNQPACVEAIKVRCSLPPSFPFTGWPG
jgi:hypothetical protein